MASEWALHQREIRPHDRPAGVPTGEPNPERRAARAAGVSVRRWKRQQRKAARE